MVKVKNKMGKADKLRSKKVTKKVLNPFEVHVNKEKIRVLGRKTKNDKGLPGIARAKAITKRKNTLGQEYIRRHKSNKFVDHRIGERNSMMSAEDRITARFAAEQQKLHGNKHSIYNLEDTLLTHKGQTLQEIEKFDDPRSDDDFSDEESGRNGTGKLEGNFVAEAHFGGGLFKNTREEGAMSRKDLIDQLIIESKKRKLEKQKERENTIEMTEKLDSEWKDLLPLVSQSKTSNVREISDKNDDYDMVVKQLKFEARGTPSDRLKTEDEIAKEEKEKLEQLELDRLSRMNSGITEKNSQNKHRSADDLDDGLYIETEPDFTLQYDKDGNLIDNLQHVENDDEHLNANENEEDNSDEVGSDDDESEADSLNDLKADETSSEESELGDNDVDKTDMKKDEADGSITMEKDQSDSIAVEELSCLPDADNIQQPMSLDSKTEEQDNQKLISDKDTAKKIKDDLLKRKKVMDKAAAELPYTFKVPKDYDELEQLLSNQSSVHQSIIVERMIKCNHPSVSEGNKEKLGTLLAYLLQYLNDIFSCIDKNLSNSFSTLDHLMPYIYDLCQMNPSNAYICFMEVMKEKQNDFRKNKNSYPGLDTLIFFKLLSVLFPTSDFRHQVVTPALVFMSQILSRCKVKTKRDIVSGMFLVTLLLEYTVLSKRFMPAALNFIGGIIHLAIPKKPVQLVKALPPFKSHGAHSSLLVLEETEDLTALSQDIKLTSLDFVNERIDETFKKRVFCISLQFLDEFCNNLDTLSGADMLFEYHIRLLPLVHIDKYPDFIKQQYEKTNKSLKKCKDQIKEFLQLEKARPKALRLYEPNIEKIIYDGKRHRPMSKEKAEHEKLLHKYKKEMKGALREIRRDKSYLANMQLKKQMASDVERKEKVKRIYAEAALQQGELNALKRRK